MKSDITVRQALLVIALSIVAACATLGLPTPTTFEEKLSAGVATVTAARDTTTSLLTAGKITSADAQHVQDQLNNARVGLDIARSLRNTDPVGADNKLTSIRTALVALQAYLASKGG